MDVMPEHRFGAWSGVLVCFDCTMRFYQLPVSSLRPSSLYLGEALPMLGVPADLVALSLYCFLLNLHHLLRCLLSAHNGHTRPGLSTR
jgi:hypothetical protein